MACLDDTTLAGYVERRLGAEDAAAVDDHLDACDDCRHTLSLVARALPRSPVGIEAPPPIAVATEISDGSRVGRYVVTGLLGRGGMGTVFAAHDPELGRRVALKVINPGRARDGDRERDEARLVREARAMAMISHPNVVAVHDVGVTDGRVFLVMDLVSGEPLSAWLRVARSPRAILAMFLQAAAGLAAAHRAGVVHRDFKPDNVLVDDDGRARVTDFGLARSPGTSTDPVAEALLAPHPPRPVEQTGTYDPAGTPAYMAPEQHVGRPSDARSDQFAFSVALWEAIAGVHPFPHRSSHGLETTTPRAGMATLPRYLRRILIRATAARPEDRYETIDELIVVLARANARRRRRPVILGTGAVAIATVVVVTQTRLVVDDTTPCDGAAAGLEAVWSPARREVLSATLRAPNVPYAEWTSREVVARLDAYAASWREIRTGACMATHVRHEASSERYAQRLTCLDDRKLEMAALVEALLAGEATVQNATRAVDGLAAPSACTSLVALPPGSRPRPPHEQRQLDGVRAQLARSRVLREAGRYDAAAGAAGSALTGARKLDDPRLVAEALGVSADLARRRADPSAKDALYEAAAAADAVPDDTLRAEAYIGLLKLIGGTEARLDEGERVTRLARAALARIGSPRALESTLELALGAMLVQHARFADARVAFERARELAIEERGPEELAVTEGESSLGNLELAEGKFDAAKRHYERALEIERRHYGPDHPEVAAALDNVGIASLQLGDAEDARQRSAAALAIRERTIGPDHPDTATSLINLSNALLFLDLPAEALSGYERALAIDERALGADHPTVATILLDSAAALGQLGRGDDALVRLQRALAIQRLRFGDRHPAVGTTLAAMGDALDTLHRWTEAKARLAEALEILESALGPQHPDLFAPLSLLGGVELALRRASSAEVHLRRAIAIGEATQLPAPMLAEARFRLARALWVGGRDRRGSIAMAQLAILGFEADLYRENRDEVAAWLSRRR